MIVKQVMAVSLDIPISYPNIDPPIDAITHTSIAKGVTSHEDLPMLSMAIPRDATSIFYLIADWLIFQVLRQYGMVLLTNLWLSWHWETYWLRVKVVHDSGMRVCIVNSIRLHNVGFWEVTGLAMNGISIQNWHNSELAEKLWPYESRTIICYNEELRNRVMIHSTLWRVAMRIGKVVPTYWMTHLSHQKARTLLELYLKDCSSKENSEIICTLQETLWRRDGVVN